MSVTWGDSIGGNPMKYLFWAIVLYEGGMGIYNLATQGDGTSYPSVGNYLENNTSSVTVQTGGIIDLAVAAIVWYFAIHR
jgi:hypothetical protein